MNQLAELKETIKGLKEMLILELLKGKKRIPVTTMKRKILSEKELVFTLEKPSLYFETFEELQKKVSGCTKCRLASGRTNIVFGSGNRSAKLVFVGEGPGRDEDIQGLPFVGRAGQLLTKIIEAMGFSRSDVYICNVIKCRPPENRNPQNDEIEACRPYLLNQLSLIKPLVIVALGTFATQVLLNTDEKITALRGRFWNLNGISVMPTYHPAYLLRNPDMKKEVWEDMKKVMKYLNDADDSAKKAGE